VQKLLVDNKNLKNNTAQYSATLPLDSELLGEHLWEIGKEMEVSFINCVVSTYNPIQTVLIFQNCTIKLQKATKTHT